MFGQTNPFGQSSNSPFNSQFGQTNTANSNPFAPKPFGSTTPFGSQTGGSIFGGTSTGVFGAAQSSSPAFGATPSPAFGSSMPSFGASSTPAFGTSPSSSSFGGSSVFGQKQPSVFGSAPTQASQFGSTFQQSQPAFGSSIFGSTPFGASSQPTFGAPSTPAFGSTSTPTFGAPSTPAFGSTASPTFGNTGSTFGGSGAPVFGSGGAFGASSTPGFGASSTPVFGSTNTSAFGAPSTSAFGASSTPAFGASSSPSFSFTSTPAFGSSTFGSTPSSFGAQTSAFGAQSTTPTFGQTAFGGQRVGSRVAPYTPTTDTDGASASQPAGKLESISAMPVYKEKSHEELRWEDYQQGDKGGPNPTAQTGFNTSTTQSSPFPSSSTFGQSSSNPFSTSTSSNPFNSSSSIFGTPATSTFNASPFAAPSTTNPFASTSSTSPSLFPTSTPGFVSNPSSSSAFGPSQSIFGSMPAQGTPSTFSTGLNLGNTQSSSLFPSTAPTFGQTTSAFGQTTPAFGQSSTAPFGQSSTAPFGQSSTAPFGQSSTAPFGQSSTAPFGQSTTAPFGQTTTPPFGQSNMFNTSSNGGFGGNLFSSTSSQLPSSNTGIFNQTTSSLSTPFQPTQLGQTSGGFNNFGQTQIATGGFGQSPYGQMSANQSTLAPQPVPNTNPYGTLPAMPQMSIGRAGTSPTVQYGISSMPVIEKTAPVRISSLLTSRHFSQRRIKLPARKYHPNDGPKVPFFSDDGEIDSTPKADALFVPRENPRALVINPMEQRPLRAIVEKTPPREETSKPIYANGKTSEGTSLNVSNGDSKGKNIVENGYNKEPNHSTKINQKPNGVHLHDHSMEKGDSHITVSKNKVHENGTDIDALMPKLQRSDYYTEPSIQELAAKERAEPGFCTRVKNFVVGRHGCGSIKFLGETNVQKLDLESLIQFNNKEVIVYLDETKKPPIGQGLNKPAEVTLLNIKCIDKKTGRQYTEGEKIERYSKQLKRKTEEQGAEFVSYDPVGEWKFRVSHFSAYALGEEDEWDIDV